jgi:AcrR family transcriptional regulator
MPRPFHEAEKAQIRAALLDAARAALARGGLRRTPIETLVREAGISKGAFYLFFESKEALVIELLVGTERQLRGELRAVVPAQGEPLDPLIRCIFEGVARHPLLSALGDPEERAWLMRALPPGFEEEARLDDARFFTHLFAEVGVTDVPGEVLAGIGAVALSLARDRGLVGEVAYAPLVTLLVESLARRLGADRPG